MLDPFSPRCSSPHSSSSAGGAHERPDHLSESRLREGAGPDPPPPLPLAGVRAAGPAGDVGMHAPLVRPAEAPAGSHLADVPPWAGGEPHAVAGVPRRGRPGAGLDS